MAEEGPEGFGGVSPADFFAGVFGAGFVGDGAFVDFFAEDEGFGGDFGAELEAVADEIHFEKGFAVEGFVAGGFVGDFGTVEEEDRPGEENVDDFVGEGHFGVETLGEAGAVDDIGFVVEDRFDEGGDLFGGVFQVGVLDDDGFSGGDF